jgi:hypothetical protein
MELMEQILKLLGGIVIVGGGGGVVTYGLLKYFGKKWIDIKFAQQLEGFKHDQAKEIQRLRGQIDAMLSGTLKVQEKEFETLPEAWAKLDEAISHSASLIAPFQTYQDLERIRFNPSHILRLRNSFGIALV